MPTPRAEKTLLQDHGYGAARLAAVTARIDWSRPDAMARARDALALYAGTVGELLRDAAKNRRRTLGKFLNDLIAASSETELPLLWLALRYAERNTPTTGLLATRRALLDNASAPVAAHWRLLRDGTLPAARLPEIAPVETDTLLALQAAQLAKAGTLTTAASTLRLLKFAAAQNEGRAALLRHVRLVQKLVTGDAGHPRLDYDAFRGLPAALRRVLLFTSGMAEFFLDPEALAASRPPSPAFDPLFFERALENLAHGKLDHVDVDTLFISAASTPAFRARIVTALANGSGRLACSDDVRERLIAGAELAELGLVACAAARSPDDVQRALSRLAALPRHGILGEGLLRFALIAWRDWLPTQIPVVLTNEPAFCDGMLDAAARRLAAHVLATPNNDDIHQAPALLFRHVVAWLNCSGPRAARDAIAALTDALARAGGALAGDIDGNDICALHRAGPRGAVLARTLVDALRAQAPAAWSAYSVMTMRREKAITGIGAVEKPNTDSPLPRNF